MLLALLHNASQRNDMSQHSRFVELDTHNTRTQSHTLRTGGAPQKASMFQLYTYYRSGVMLRLPCSMQSRCRLIKMLLQE